MRRKMLYRNKIAKIEINKTHPALLFSLEFFPRWCGAPCEGTNSAWRFITPEYFDGT